jgi:hypothetical protein
LRSRGERNRGGEQSFQGEKEITAESGRSGVVYQTSSSSPEWEHYRIRKLC